MRWTLRSLWAVAVAVGATAVLAGCGGSGDAKPAPTVSGDTRGILATVDALQTASRQDDAARICGEIFAESLARSIRHASKRSCEAEVRATLTAPDARYSVGRDIQVTGSRATATVREQNGNTSRLSFVKQGERWRIDRVTPVKPK
jgi:hypothetical protein